MRVGPHLIRVVPLYKRDIWTDMHREKTDDVKTHREKAL